MTDFGKHIVQEQNTDISIKYLASQKQIYSRGKKAFAFQVLIAVPLPIIISIITPLLETTGKKLIWVFILYSIIATLLELFLENNSCKLKKLAASIQETFDCSVLLINWNATLIPKKPSLEIIFRYYKKYIKKNDLENLYGWYSNKVETVKTNIATLLCQRTNCNYDFSLRTRYSNSVLILAILTFTILLIISGFFEVSLTSFITSVLFPSLPIFVLAYKQITSNQEAIKDLTELQDLIEKELQKINVKENIDENLIRQIQDKIYLKRIHSPLLPEWAYDFLRLRLEEEMHFSVEKKISELNNHSN